MDRPYSSDRFTQLRESTRELAESIEEYSYRIQRLLARRETLFRQRYGIDEDGDPVG